MAAPITDYCSPPLFDPDPAGSAELDRNEWLDDGVLTDAGKALIEQRFRGLEANPHASVLWEEAKIRLKTLFKQ